MDPHALATTLRLDLLLKLALAVLLGGAIGLERQIAGKPAGLRTNILICLGSALIMDLSLHVGLGDDGVRVGDPGRIAAQVVSGIGFIGAGVIFTRRDGVRGLTTAATVWLVAAVGLAAGGGLIVLATLGTALHLVVAFLFTPLVHRLPRSRVSLASVEVSYRDGRGILRSVLSRTTELGYLVSEVEVTRHDPSRDIVSVSIDAEGVREPSELVDALQALGGVVEVRSRHPSAD
jgi:putative Mg2+ transporter-C (MgtC) family protein